MIEPLGKNILIKVEEAKAGVLDMSNRASAIEYGEIVSKGAEVKLKIEKGDKIYFKSWGVDTTTDREGNKLYFINEDTGAILAHDKEV